LGQEISVSDVFEEGDVVKVSGISKGKGFAGVVKRYHFHGGDMGHGSMIHRKPQSSGATDAARTFKGQRKPGHMGAKTVTVRGLTIWQVDGDKNLLLIRGAVPGANGGLLTISKI
jgi:large subunit ribosomal protein L3